MASTLLLGVRLSASNFQKIKIENVDFDKKIEEFKNDVSEKANIPKESLELVFCGNILDDDATLNSSGLKPGVMVHVLKKKAKESPRPAQQMSELDIQALVVAFRTLTLNPSYKNALQKLSRPDILENIIMITPGLSQDPVAISMIQDPELLVRLGDIETVRRIVDVHPALAEAANHIAAAVHEEAIASASNSSQPSTSSGYSNILELLTDEEDMESSQGVSGQLPLRPITAAQIASALAAGAQGRTATAPPTSESDSNLGEGITIEMFNQALLNAIAAVTPSATNPPANPAPNPEETVTTPEREDEEGREDLTEQMRQMRELGLTDDALNLQALQLSGGNLHAAVELVFSGAISPNNPYLNL